MTVPTLAGHTATDVAPPCDAQDGTCRRPARRVARIAACPDSPTVLLLCDGHGAAALVLDGRVCSCGVAWRITVEPIDRRVSR